MKYTFGYQYAFFCSPEKPPHDFNEQLLSPVLQAAFSFRIHQISYTYYVCPPCECCFVLTGWTGFQWKLFLFICS